MRVYSKDLRQALYCNKGARKWFERHGLDWADFIKNGVDISEIEHIDDSMMQKIVENVRAKNG